MNDQRVETNGERAERLGVMPAVKCPKCDEPVPVFGSHVCGGPIFDAMGNRITDWSQVDARGYR